MHFYTLAFLVCAFSVLKNPALAEPKQAAEQEEKVSFLRSQSLRGGSPPLSLPAVVCAVSGDGRRPLARPATGAGSVFTVSLPLGTFLAELASRSQRGQPGALASVCQRPACLQWQGTSIPLAGCACAVAAGPCPSRQLPCSGGRPGHRRPVQAAAGQPSARADRRLAHVRGALQLAERARGGGAQPRGGTCSREEGPGEERGNAGLVSARRRNQGVVSVCGGSVGPDRWCREHTHAAGLAHLGFRLRCELRLWTGCSSAWCPPRGASWLHSSLHHACIPPAALVRPLGSARPPFGGGAHPPARALPAGTEPDMSSKPVMCVHVCVSDCVHVCEAA